MGGRRLENLIGQKFGHLTAIAPVKRGDTVEWLCACDCGKTTYARAAYLKSGRIKSCGCAKSEGVRTASKATKTKWKQNLDKARQLDTYEGMRISRIKQSLEGRTRKSISGITGVTWSSEKNRWRASIGYKGKTIFLGSFKTLAEAAQAREDAEKKYYIPLLKRYKQDLPLIKARVEQSWQDNEERRKREVKRCDDRRSIIEQWQKTNKEKQRRKLDEQIKRALKRRKRRFD